MAEPEESDSTVSESALADQIVFRQPKPVDAKSINTLIKNSPPLDPNSLYCNLLQCSHFAQTCVVAEKGQDIVGFVSGYRRPDDATRAFIWQLVVSEQARGRGLAKKLVKQFLGLPSISGASYLETTVNPSNIASFSLFESLAKELKVDFSQSVLFSSETHFAGEHEDENLLQLGPM